MPRRSSSAPARPPVSMGGRLAEFVRVGDQLRARMHREAEEVDRLDASRDPALRAQLVAALRRLGALGDELAAHASRHREHLKLG